MNHYNSSARRSPRAPGLLLLPLSVVCLTLPETAVGAMLQDKVEAAKVAQKVDKAGTTAPQTEEERRALADFKKQLAKYAVLHSRQQVRLGGKHSAVTQTTLARAIGDKRAKAKQGDVFLPTVQPLFRRLIDEQLKGAATLDARKAIADGNPATEEEASVPVVVRVNALYPSGASRSTVPASVLLALPVLPSALHYRFVGRDLILIDSVAQIIVDFIPMAAPALPGA